MGGVGVSQHRASVGCFYDKSLKRSTRHLSFINTRNVYSCLLMIFHGVDGLKPALLLFMLLDCSTSVHFNLVNNELYLFPEIVTTLENTRHVFIERLMLCGDVHPNPGPLHHDKLSKLSIVHNNIGSLQNKAHYIEAELTNFDIITVSETWLYPEFPPERILITGFNPPVRKDRESEGGGVAIYVKNNVFYKPRPDLNVDNLEAVWVETKLNQEPLLVGTFYRPPDAKIAYWDLIDESIRLAMSTPLKVVILGDFNSNFTDGVPRHPQFKRILDLNSLNQIVTEPTRETE